MVPELALAGTTAARMLPPVSKRGVGRPRGSNGEVRRPLIVSAAIHIFAYRGYDAATLQEVADLVDITRPAVHHYFPGKAPLYRAALDRAYEIVMPALAARPTEVFITPPQGEMRLASALLGASLAQSNRIADIAPRIITIADELRSLCENARGTDGTDTLLAAVVGRWVLTASTLSEPDVHVDVRLL